MAATLTRRAVRRARLGGRHTYRALVRHRVAAVVAAVAAALTLSTAVAVGHEAPPVVWGPPVAHGQMHGPMPGGMPDHPWGPHRN